MKKFLICFITSIILMFSLIHISYAGTDTETAQCQLVDKGDLNKDNKISLRDALITLKVAAKLQTLDNLDFDKADVDGSDSITIEDARYVMQAALEGGNFGYICTEPNTIIVDSATIVASQSNCYTSLTSAVNYLNSNPPKSEEDRITVIFAPGVYREHTELKAPYVSYISMNPDSEEPVNITFYYGCGFKYYSLSSNGAGSGDSSTIINKSAHDFIADGIQFENSYNIYVTLEEYADYCPYPINQQAMNIRENEENLRNSRYQTQGLALGVHADRCKFYNCDIVGRQDTLFINGGGNRTYFENCYIEGTVDFIYGNGISVFKDSQINSPYHSGHITAASTPADQKFGYLFDNCTLTREQVTPKEAPLDDSYSLGRPWNQPAMVVYWNCKMDKHITAGDDRFVVMGGDTGFDKKKARYMEVGSMDIEGSLLDLATVCPEYETILQQEDMLPGGTYSAYDWLKGSDGWNPASYPQE